MGAADWPFEDVVQALVQSGGATDRGGNVPIGIAVVGAGYWGPNLVRNLHASQDFDLRWLCDLDQERAHRVGDRYSGVRVTAEFEEVLADEGVEAVAIATPASTHAPIGRAALHAGRHVLLEKPLAASTEEAAELVRLADEYGRTLMCDHTFCYTPAVQYLRDLVGSGELGDVLFVDSVRINLGLVQPDVDVFWDLAPHDLSILDFVLPGGLRPIGVAAHGADPIGAGVACLGYLSLPLPGGAIAGVHVNWLSPTKIRHMVIGGSRRTVVWDDLNPQQRISVYDRGVDLSPMGGVSADTKRKVNVSYRLGDMHAPALPEREALMGMVTEFAAAIRENRPPLTDGRGGQRVLEVLSAASRSQQAGGAFIDMGTRPMAVAQ